MSVNSFSGQPAIPASYGFTAGKNKIINGDFGVWQRGTSFSLSTGVNTYTADRFTAVCTTGTTVSRQAFTAGSAPVSGYEAQYYLNQTITANSQNYETAQYVEDARTFAGQTVTLSFWARSTVGAQLLNVQLLQYFGTGGSPSATTTSTYVSGNTGSATYTPTSSWVRYTFTFNVPSVSGKTFGTNNNSYLWVRLFQYTTTATNTSVDIWGVQLEAGSTATSFQTATGTIQGELAACQRYYFRNTLPTSTVVSFALGRSSTQVDIVLPLPTTMRTNPTAIEYGGGTFQVTNPNVSTVNLTGFTFTHASYQTAYFRGDAASGLSQGTNYILQPPTSGYIGFSAEL